MQEYEPARSGTPRLQHIGLLRCEADRSEFGIHALSPRCSKHPVSRSASQPSVSPCDATARRTSLARITLLLKRGSKARSSIAVSNVHLFINFIDTLKPLKGVICLYQRLIPVTCDEYIERKGVVSKQKIFI